MATKHPLFLGLTRPAKFAGLPIHYLFVVGLTIPFIIMITRNPLYLVISGILWLIFRAVADKEPYIFESIIIRFDKAWPTSNRGRWGGDSYAA